MDGPIFLDDMVETLNGRMVRFRLDSARFIDQIMSDNRTAQAPPPSLAIQILQLDDDDISELDLNE
jgi:hypothetical protein